MIDKCHISHFNGNKNCEFLKKKERKKKSLLFDRIIVGWGRGEENFYKIYKKRHSFCIFSFATNS